jgi:SAM-dependent methyltransferase
MDLRRRIVASLARRYFDLSFRLLAGTPQGRQFLRLSSVVGGMPIHGYATLDDLAAIIRYLRLRDGAHVLDIGSGLGGPALAIGQQTGARITGLDPSPTAVRAASHRASDAGLGDRISFMVGSTQQLPGGSASGAYALDSLMFVPIDVHLIHQVCCAVADGGRLVSTVLAVGPQPIDPLARVAAACGMRVLSSVDVTPAMLDRSERRRRLALRSLRRPGTSSGRLAMLLVIAEETAVGYQARRGRLRRWQTVIELRRTELGRGSTPPTKAKEDRTHRTGGDHQDDDRGVIRGPAASRHDEPRTDRDRGPEGDETGDQHRRSGAAATA